MEVNVFENDKLEDIFRNDLFINNWIEIYNKCEWATVFQHPSFVISWYRIYKEKFSPIFITGSENGNVVTIFPLAFSEDRKIFGAGGDQAEYQIWISVPSNNFEFWEKAYKILKNKFSNSFIRLKYVPYSFPINDLIDGRNKEKSIYWKRYAHPLMKIGHAQIKEELTKKNKKEKLNRLKRKGNLVFQKIDSNLEFEKVIDELIMQNDFRKGAIYEKFTFKSDSNRRMFFIDLFSKKLLHATVLKLDNEIIASNIGFYGKKIVHLQGLNTHSPFYSKYSPGILHFLFLGLELENEDFDYFDLTPGGIDGYKSMLATEQQKSIELTIASKVQIGVLKSKEILESILRKTFPEKEMQQNIKDRLFNSTDRIRYSLMGVSGIFSKEGWEKGKKISQSLQVKLLSGQNIEDLNNSFKINHIPDLLVISLGRTNFSKSEFLFDAMKRFELGQNVYTFITNKELIASIWYIPKGIKTGEKSGKVDLICEASCLYIPYFNKKHIKELNNLIEIVASDILSKNVGIEGLVHYNNLN